MNLEEKLLARVLYEGTAQKALSRGVHEGWFSDPILRSAWAEVTKHTSRPATRNETPSIKRLERKIVGLKVLSYCPEEPMSELIADMIDVRARATIQGGIIDIDEALNSSGVEAAAETLIQISRQLLQDMTVQSHMAMSLVDSIPDYMETYAAVAQGGGITGMPCPWGPLNNATGGLQAGCLYVVYAPPKSGKTFFGLELGAVHPFERGNARVLVMTYEMPVKQIFRRILSRLCRLDYGHVLQGSLSLDARDQAWDCLTELQETQIDAARENVEHTYKDIRVAHGQGLGVSHVRAEAEMFEPDIILVDGLYLMSDDRSKSRDASWRSNTHITQDLKVLATELNIPIVATTQANREGAKRKAGAGMSDYTDVGFGMGAVMDADFLLRLHKVKNAHDEDRILVTMPAVRESVTDAFVLRFAPMIDFGVDISSVTQEEVEEMMHHQEEEEPRRRSSRSQRRDPPPSEEFTFTNVNPFE